MQDLESGEPENDGPIILNIKWQAWKMQDLEDAGPAFSILRFWPVIFQILHFPDLDGK